MFTVIRLLFCVYCDDVFHIFTCFAARFPFSTRVGVLKLFPGICYCSLNVLWYLECIIFPGMHYAIVS